MKLPCKQASFHARTRSQAPGRRPAEGLIRRHGYGTAAGGFHYSHICFIWEIKHTRPHVPEVFPPSSSVSYQGYLIQTDLLETTGQTVVHPPGLSVALEFTTSREEANGLSKIRFYPLKNDSDLVVVTMVTRCAQFESLSLEINEE